MIENLIILVVAVNIVISFVLGMLWYRTHVNRETLMHIADPYAVFDEMMKSKIPVLVDGSGNPIMPSTIPKSS